MFDQPIILTANTAPDTITAVAIACWQEDHDEDCPADMIPSIVEHGEFVSSVTQHEFMSSSDPNKRYIRKAVREANKLLFACFGRPSGWTAFTVANHDHSITLPMLWAAVSEPAESPREGQPNNQSDALPREEIWGTAAQFEAQGIEVPSRRSGQVFSLRGVQLHWIAARKDNRDLLHPLAPLMRAWQKWKTTRLREDESDKKANAILPDSLSKVRDLRSEQGGLFGEFSAMDHTGLSTIREPGLLGSLPGFEPAEPAVVPSLPLVLFDMTGGVSTARGRGAPLMLRVWVECVLWGKPGERSVPRRLTCTLREFINAIWPNGSYRRGHDGPKLLRALYNVHNARVPWTDPETGQPGGYWAAVRVLNMPKLNDMNSSIVFEVSLPPGSGVGPMIHRPTLRKYGVISAPAYRSSLGLAYLWNRHLTHKGRRLPPTVPIVGRNPRGVVLDAKGRPLTGKGGRAVTHWSDPRAVRTGDYKRNPELARLPWLTPEDLLALANPEANLTTKQARSDALQRACKALRMMEEKGDLVIVENGSRWRLEPPDWWGAPGGNATHKRRAG